MIPPLLQNPNQENRDSLLCSITGLSKTKQQNYLYENVKHLIISSASEPRCNEEKREPEKKWINAKPEMGEKSAKDVGGKPKVVEDRTKSGDESATRIETSSDDPGKGALESSKSEEAPERPKAAAGAPSPKWKRGRGKIIWWLWNTDRSRPFTHLPHAVLGK